MYHAVGTRLGFGVPGLSINPGLFRDHMRWLKHESGLPAVALEPSVLERSSSSAAVTFDDGYRDNLDVAAPILASLGIPFTVFAVPAYVMGGQAPYLDLTALKELAAAPGCRIGSHGMTHRPMAKLSAAEMAEEAGASRRWLEDKLGRPVAAFSYPHGSANRRARAAVAEAGYGLAACSRTGVNARRRDPMMLCRTEILSFDSSRAFRQKISGSWDWHRFRHKDPLSIP